MLHTRKLQSLLFAAAAFLVTGVAFADTSTPKPCQADVKKLCKNVKPAHGAVLICLEQKADKVSQACQASLTDRAQAVESACKPDLDQFCKDVQHGEGRLLQCLAKNEANLSADCKAFWTTAKSKTKTATKK